LLWKDALLNCGELLPLRNNAHIFDVPRQLLELLSPAWIQKFFEQFVQFVADFDSRNSWLNDRIVVSTIDSCT